MKRVEQIIVSCLLLATAAVLGQTTSDNASQQQRQAQSGPQKTQIKTLDNRGQEVFNQNCNRCHNAPMGFSPSVAGTIARHMRVRAGLSDEDYKALIKFLNP
jgi:cytochrome c5